MITGLPIEVSSSRARMRATKSLGPPVVTGTMILMFFDGKAACADTWFAPNAPATVNNT